MKRSLVCAALLAAVSAWGQTARAQDAGPNPPAHREGAAVITNPDWVRLPSESELARYEQGSLLGDVKLECDITADGKLTGCIVLYEYPKSFGLGQAAISMSHLFQMKPRTEDGRPVGGGVVQIPIHFGVPVGQAQWVRRPTPAEMAAVWPQGASDDGGDVSLECFVTLRQEVKNCHVRRPTADLARRP